MISLVRRIFLHKRVITPSSRVCSAQEVAMRTLSMKVIPSMMGTVMGKCLVYLREFRKYPLIYPLTFIFIHDVNRTHVAGTTCGANYGVSENCELCAVKVLDKDGISYGNSVIAGLEHVVNSCIADGATCVANMSLGGGFNSALNSAVASVVDQGIVVAVAAGNDGGNACILSPASEPKAITVGSTTITDAMSWFSDHGPCLDVFAPGSDILSAGIAAPDATATYSGTSMASPRKKLLR